MKEQEFLKEVRKFVAKLDSESDIFIGIDPGSTGAIGFLCNTDYCVIDIPILKIEQLRKGKMGTATRFNYQAICLIFRQFRFLKDRIRIALEEPPPTLGPGRHYAEVLLSRAFAMWPLYLYSRGFVVELIRPTDWKRKMGLWGKGKDTSRMVAMNNFPEAPLSRKKDKDRAEALLLAAYLRDG